MIEIAAIDHIVLRTTRLPAMLAFYCDVLACSVARKTPAELGLTQLRAGNALIDLVVVDSRLGRTGGGPPTRTENNLDHFCLQLQPIAEEEIRDHLQQKGITVGEFEERYGAEGLGRSIYIKDPDGNVVELRAKQHHNRANDE